MIELSDQFNAQLAAVTLDITITRRCVMRRKSQRTKEVSEKCLLTAIDLFLLVNDNIKLIIQQVICSVPQSLQSLSFS